MCVCVYMVRYTERGCGKDSACYARSPVAILLSCLRECPLGSRPRGQPSSSFITGHARLAVELMDMGRRLIDFDSSSIILC